MSITKPIVAFVELIEKNQKENMTVAEIGVFDGSTTRAYVEIVKKNNGLIYAVDWFYGNENVVGVHGYNVNNEQSVYKSFIDNLAGFHDVVKIKKGTSFDMIKEIPDNSLDICFIDADHRYDYAYKDISLCLPKVKKGGIICGHDCEDINMAENAHLFPSNWREIDYFNGCHLGVIKAVYDHFGKEIEVYPDPQGHGIPIWVKRL